MIWSDIAFKAAAKGPAPPSVVRLAAAHALRRECERGGMHPVRLVSAYCWRREDGVRFVHEFELTDGPGAEDARDWLMRQQPKWIFAAPGQPASRGPGSVCPHPLTPSPA